MKNIPVIVIFILTLFTSCKEYLDVKPHNRIVPKTAEDYSALIHSILDEIDYGRDNIILGTPGKMASFEAYAYNVESCCRNISSNGLPRYIGQTLSGFQGYYSNLYDKVKNFNIIINEVKNTNDFSRELLGVSYALRAICYYNLVINFCEPYNPSNSTQQLGVPIVDEFNLEAKPTRDNLEETIRFIEADLLKAIELKCENKEYRFTLNVAKAYLARLYYWIHDWKNAAKVAEELVNTHPILNGEAYKNMINSVNSLKGNEFIRAYILDEKKKKKSYDQAMGNIRVAYLSLEMLHLFDDKDIRKELFVDISKKSIKPLVARVRSAEMCLIAAESYAYQQNNAKALYFLNMIRRNRVTDFVDYTETSLPETNPNYLIKEDAEGNPLSKLMYAIISERQLELFGEGDRWFQLKHHGRPEFWVASKHYGGAYHKLITKKYMYTAPISTTDCLLIKDLKQNPGYEN